MSRYTMYSSKDDTVYINSDVILPNTKGMSFKESRKAYEEAFKMDYRKRLQEFCPDNIRKEIKADLDSHPGCKISEFCNAL